MRSEIAGGELGSRAQLPVKCTVSSKGGAVAFAIDGVQKTLGIRNR
jgi:hypothetical protein